MSIRGNGAKEAARMDAERFVDVILGPTGGVFALGFITGVFVAFRWLAPRLYSGKIQGMEMRIADLEKEIAPYREFKESMAMQAMQAKQV